MTMQQGDPTAPFDEGAGPVAYSDTADLGDTNGFRGFYSTAAGNVAIMLAGPGNTVLTLPVAANTYHPWRGKRIMATNTTVAAGSIFVGW